MPEWRSYAYSNEQNQRDFETYYGNTNEALRTNGNSNLPAQTRQDARNFETKWIPLQQVSRKIFLTIYIFKIFGISKL